MVAKGQDAKARVGERLPSSDRKFLRARAIKEIPAILQSEEVVERLTLGHYAGANGLLVATDQRLFFISKGISGAATVHEFNYVDIGSVEVATRGWSLRALTIYVAGAKQEFQVAQDTSQSIAEHVQAKIGTVPRDEPAPPLSAPPPPKPASPPSSDGSKGVMQGCLVIVVLSVVIVGGCASVLAVCSVDGDGGGDSQPAQRGRTASEVNLTILDRECLQWAHLIGLRSRSFTEQDIRENYTHWTRNVAVHCSQIRPQIRTACSEMEGIGLNPRNRSDLYDTLYALGQAGQIEEFVAAVTVWCD